MIGHLRGKLLAKQPPWLLLEVGGVGYEVEAPMSTFYELPPVGQDTALFIHHAVKEDAVALYGFHKDADRQLFRSLIKVSGVGAKTALSVLSGASVAEFARVVQAGDVAALTRIPGIGKKTAERLIVELRDRVHGLAGAIGLPGAAPMAHDPAGEAQAALQALGYKPLEATRLVQACAQEGDTAEGIIRKALKAALR